MTEKGPVLHDLELAYQEFRGPLLKLDAAAFGEVFVGEWNLSQLLAHMAGWFREMTPAFGRVARGERPTPPGVDYSNPDEWNQKFAADSRPGKAALRDFEEAWADYLAAAKALPDSFFGKDPESGKLRIGNRLLQGAGLGHFEEHQPEVEAWLKARQP